VLLSTPVVVDDVYVIQREAIVVWSDPELGREMACSFNCVEGCKVISDAIKAYQLQKRRPLTTTPSTTVTSPTSKNASFSG